MNRTKQTEILTWEKAMELIRCLLVNGKYRIALFISCECFLGAQAKHLRLLTWNDLIHLRYAVLKDEKRQYPIDLRVGDQLHEIALICYNSLAIADDSERCFINEQNDAISDAEINKELAAIRRMYLPEIKELSVSSLKKIFGKKVLQNAGENYGLALLTLSHFFNHRNARITERFINS